MSPGMKCGLGLNKIFWLFALFTLVLLSHESYGLFTLHGTGNGNGTGNGTGNGVYCSHCTGTGTGTGNDGFLYYAMYCSHYTGTGNGTGYSKTYRSIQDLVLVPVVKWVCNPLVPIPCPCPCPCPGVM